MWSQMGFDTHDPGTEVALKPEEERCYYSQPS